MIYIFSILYNPVLMATKSSILLLYLSMKTYVRFFRYASIFLLCLVNVAGLVLTLLNVFQCRPVSAALDWNPSEDAKCLSLVSLYLCSAPVNILTDCAIILLPLPILTGMRMEFKQKAVLVATFCTGIFITVVDIIRIAYLQQALTIAVEYTDTMNTPYDDLAWQVSLSFMWSAVEMHVGIVCACVLVLKPLVRKLFPSIVLDTPNMPSRQFEGQASVLSTSEQAYADKNFGQTERISPRSRTSIIPLPLVELPDDVPVATMSANGEEVSIRFPSDTLSESITRSRKEIDVSSAKAPIAAKEATAARFKAKEVDLGNMDIMDFLAVDQSGAGDTRPWDPDNCDIPDIPEMSMLEQVQVDHLMPPPSGPVRSQKCTVPMRCAPTLIPGQEPPAAFSDFIVFNDGRAKSLLDLTPQEAWRPVLLVSILFTVWGLSYGFLGSLTSQIQRILEFSAKQNLVQHNAYWIGYFIGPIFGFVVLSRFGFKVTFLVGLGIFSCGAMSFWPATTLTSFAGLLISNIIISFGLSCLEIAANPYIALAGPPHLNEARLNFAQAIQATAGALSPVLSRKVLLRSVTSRSRLVDTQWAYLAIALFVITLSVVFFYIDIPEASNADLERVSRERLHNAGLNPESTIRGASTGGLLVGFGVVTMLVYLAAQESLSYFWYDLVGELKPGVTPNSAWAYSEAALACFAVGRYTASGVAYLGVPGRYILMVCITGALTTITLAAHLPLAADGNAALAMLILTYLFESAIFPTLYAIVIRNQGSRTKLVAMGLTIAIGGGGVLPSITYALRRGESTRQALDTAVGFYAVAMLLPLFLNLSPTLKRWVDPVVAGSIHGRSDSDVSGFSANIIRKRFSDYLARFSIEHKEYATEVEMTPRNIPGNRSEV